MSPIRRTAAHQHQSAATRDALAMLMDRARSRGKRHGPTNPQSPPLDHFRVLVSSDSDSTRHTQSRNPSIRLHRVLPTDGHDQSSDSDSCTPSSPPLKRAAVHCYVDIPPRHETTNCHLPDPRSTRGPPNFSIYQALQESEPEDDFHVDQENIIHSPRKVRRGGIQDRLDRARARPQDVVPSSPSSSIHSVSCSPVCSSMSSDEWICSSDTSDVQLPLRFTSMELEDWYYLCLHHLAALAMHHHQTDDLIVTAFDKISHLIRSRLTCAISAVWGSDLLDSIRRFPRCCSSRDPRAEFCEACRRPDRRASSLLTLRGNPYNSVTFQEDRDCQLPKPARRVNCVDSSSDSSDGFDFRYVQTLSVGRFCAVRVKNYHTLYHFMYHEFLAVCDRVLEISFATVDPAFQDQSQAEIFEMWLVSDAGRDWAMDRALGFKDMLADVDDVLCNQIRAVT